MRRIDVGRILDFICEELAAELGTDAPLRGRHGIVKESGLFEQNAILKIFHFLNWESQKKKQNM